MVPAAWTHVCVWSGGRPGADGACVPFRAARRVRRAGLYTVRCRAFKELLASSAEALVRKLLDQVRASGRASNVKVHEEYALMAAEVMKPSHTGEEVLALKKLIQRSVADGERLRDTIAQNKARDDFLMSHR